VKSGGGSFGRVGLYVGEDWWTWLSTYKAHTPILDISCGSTSGKGIPRTLYFGVFLSVGDSGISRVSSYQS